ncbi:hypothetical protein C8R43DRAFT_1244970 [Mycena crocata]|nr:hypothetical protein C8R43DRAFT_1244970 [Mycena crocata]
MPRATTKATTTLVDRAQRAVLSTFDRSTYDKKAGNLPRMPAAGHAALPKHLSAIGILGKSTIYSLAKQVLYDERPETDDVHEVGDSNFYPLYIRRTLIYQQLCGVLVSSATSARLLLDTGDYEDQEPSPFFGMAAPSVGSAFALFVGLFMLVSGNLGLRRFRPWFVIAFRPLAKAAVKSLDLKAKFTRPLLLTTRAQLVAVRTGGRKGGKNPEAMTPLADVTNKPAATSTVPVAVEKDKKLTTRRKPKAKAPVRTPRVVAHCEIFVDRLPSTCNI